MSAVRIRKPTRNVYQKYCPLKMDVRKVARKSANVSTRPCHSGPYEPSKRGVVYVMSWLRMSGDAKVSRLRMICRRPANQNGPPKALSIAGRIEPFVVFVDVVVGSISPFVDCFLACCCLLWVRRERTKKSQKIYSQSHLILAISPSTLLNTLLEIFIEWWHEFPRSVSWINVVHIGFS